CSRRMRSAIAGGGFTVFGGTPLTCSSGQSRGATAMSSRTRVPSARTTTGCSGPCSRRSTPNTTVPQGVGRSVRPAYSTTLPAGTLPNTSAPCDTLSGNTIRLSCGVTGAGAVCANAAAANSRATNAVIPASRAKRDNGEAGPKGECAVRVTREPGDVCGEARHRLEARRRWVPAFAGMTERQKNPSTVELQPLPLRLADDTLAVPRQLAVDPGRADARV